MENNQRKTAVISKEEIKKQKELCEKVIGVISKRYDTMPLACVIPMAVSKMLQTVKKSRVCSAKWAMASLKTDLKQS